jgi:glycerol uptake facilitator-like aquaporin
VRTAAKLRVVDCVIDCIRFAVGDISGGAFNPAVAVGISILGLSSWSNIWIYVLANFAAAVVAAVVFNVMNPPTQTTPIATDEPPYKTPR